MSSQGISMRDTKAISEYIKTLDFYKEFMTYTQIKNSELSKEAELEEDDESSVGRPALDDQDIENDATAASRESGTNTADNRDQ